MKAQKILEQKIVLAHRDGAQWAVFEIVVWDVGVSTHFPDGIKYRAWLSQGGETIFGFDNHKPKGPHLHIGNRELPYEYAGLDRLRTDIIRLIELEGFIYED